MSYDLSIRPGGKFSEFRPVAPLSAFLATQPDLRPNGKRGYVLDSTNRWMEIDIETVGEEGDNIEDGSTAPDIFNCIRAHIPYGYLAEQPQLDYFPLLRSIAQQVGWQLYDEQSDDGSPDYESEPRKPWWKFW
jgi:hypothetical protein